MAVGSKRVLIPREVALRLGARDLNALSVALQPLGATTVVEVSDEQVETLLRARSVDELTIERAAAPPSLNHDETDWHLRTTRTPEAWALLAGNDFSSIDWSGVKVGQIDTGYRKHPALGWTGGVSSFVDTENDKNFFSDDTRLPTFSVDDALDPLLNRSSFDGHGTRTGSVLAGYVVRQQGAGTVSGYFGVAPKVPYIPVRISDHVFVSNEQQALAQAIDHLRQRGCGVITLSMGFLPFGGLGVVNSVREAINLAYDAGVIIVCAAGNHGGDVVAPACLNRTIAVGGSTESGFPWIRSCRGSEIDICAPAWEVFRASVDKRGNPIYGKGDGTSFATAMVAGAAALWLAHHRGVLAAQYLQAWQRVAAFREALRLSAIQNPGWDTSNFGAGILNTEALLQLPLPNAAASPEPLA
jgi:subtilisin family serine protease